MKQILVIATILSLSACSGETGGVAAGGDAATITNPTIDKQPSESYADALARAQAALERATELGHAWSTSDQYLADAESAHVAGETSEAIRLADEARIHAELAIIQANRETAAWRDNIIGD